MDYSLIEAIAIISGALGALWGIKTFILDKIKSRFAKDQTIDSNYARAEKLEEKTIILEAKNEILAKQVDENSNKVYALEIKLTKAFERIDESRVKNEEESFKTRQAINKVFKALSILIDHSIMNSSGNNVDSLVAAKNQLDNDATII